MSDTLEQDLGSISENPDLKKREPSLLTSMELKWKRKHLFWLIAGNFLITFLIIVEIILVSRDLKGSRWNIALTAVGLPISMTLLLCYMKTATSEYRDFSTIIKKERLKYYYRGTSCSFISCNLSLLILVLSICLSGGSSKTMVTIFSYLIMFACMGLGIASSALISVYEFCACFDIFYHKNKEIIIKEYLTTKHSLKILEEGEKEEGKW